MPRQNYQKIKRAFALVFIVGISHLISAQTYAPVKIKDKWGYEDVSTKKIIISNLDQALPFNNGIALAQKNGMWGGLNHDFQKTIAFKYDALKFIAPSHLSAQKKTKYFLLDLDGEKVFDNGFTDLAALAGCSDTFVVADHKYRYGIVSANGSYLIQPRFASPPQKFGPPNLLIFHKQNRNSFYAGVVNLYGKVVIPFQYLFVQMYGTNAIKATRLNGNSSYYSLDGNLIYESKSEGHVVIDEMFVRVTEGANQTLYNRQTGVSYTANQWLKLGKWYYSKNEGDSNTIVITDAGTSFTLSGSVYLNGEYEGYIRVSKKTGRGYLYGLIDDKGNEIHELNLVDLREWNERWAVIKEKDQKLYSLFDITTQKTVLKPMYTNIELYPCGYLKLYNHSVYSYMDPDLKTFDPANLTNLQDLPVYYAWSDRQRSELERKYTYLKPGQSMSDYKSQSDGCEQRFYDFSKIQRISLIKDRYGKNPLENRLLFSVFVNDQRKYGLLDFNGKVIVPPLYHGIAHYENGLIPFYTTQRLEYKEKSVGGLLDTDGNVVLNPIYDKIERAVEGIAIVQVHGLYQMVHIQSQKVLLSKFNSIRYNDDGYFILYKHGLNGMADKHGKILIQPIYKEISYRPDETGMYTAERDGAKYYVDLEGNEYPKSE